VGNLAPLSFKTKGLGGAVTVDYVCDGCGSQAVQFESSSKYELLDSTEIGIAIQVAFIISGCTYATYNRVLHQAFGIDAYSSDLFSSTIARMHPVVEQMVDEMCEEAKSEMRELDSSQLGSWNQAVTSADGTWLTRGYHSKNSTFSIRNYFNGALLYYKHLGQAGRDDIIKEDLYKGTSKSTEGFSADITFKKAKEEGMNIAIHWQDADSSSSNAVAKHFPDAKIMQCGGHAGRSHKKQLESLSKMKCFSEAFQNKHSKKFPQVEKVTCHCQQKHKEGCGCLSPAFIENARNNFSFALSAAQSSEEFAQKMTSLARHARDEHQWEGGQCDFHPMRVCSCGECKQGELKCEGREYHTKYVLSCPLHSLAYEIECEYRASMADDLVHPTLKRGHSNIMEASHNVLIRFRPKHIHLERLHYEVATNLGLLQANMTYLYEKRGPNYHWIPDLYRRLKLPVYDGLEELLEADNEERKQRLDDIKTEKSKKRRIQQKKKRAADAQERVKWSKRHGKHTYGDADDVYSGKGSSKRVKQAKGSSMGQCRCGSTTHKRISHKDCPLNKKNLTPFSFTEPKERPIHVADASESAVQEFQSDSEDGMLYEEDFSSDDAEVSSCSSLDYCIPECTCGSGSRAHKRGCPMSSRQCYSGAHLFAEVRTSSPELHSKSRVASKPKRERSTEVIDLPHAKKGKVALVFKAGDYVCVHSNTLKQQHVPCRVAEVVGERFRLCTQHGVLSTCYSARELTPLESGCHIPLDGWRLASRVSFPTVITNPVNTEACHCIRLVPSEAPIDLTEDPDELSTTSEAPILWIDNSLYQLRSSDREMIVSTKWLRDNVITAAQLLIQKDYPRMIGLQPTTLQQTLSFPVYRGDFVQILNIDNIHWCVVTNVGCEDGVVKVFDSMYASVSDATIRVIASLLFPVASKLVIQVMDMERQSNTADCGVLSIAYAYDICSGRDPCGVIYDHTSIRNHLAKCLEECQLSRFPVLCERESGGVRHVQEIGIFCVCRLPEAGDMAECESCKEWFHQHCLDIPNEVFSNSRLTWVCKACTSRDCQ